LADQAMARVDETSSVGFSAIVELRGDIDQTALAEAWGRLAALHPILTCVREGTKWRPVGPPPMGGDEMAPNHDQPPVALRVTPAPDGLRLTMLCNHVAFDGVASLILVGDLRDEYESVLEGRPVRPPDWAPRTLEAHTADVDWRTATTAALRSASSWWRAPVSTHVDPGPMSDLPAEDHAILEMGPVLETLTPARRRYHWSVDAVLVGVLEKAWAEVFGPPRAESTWLVARDMRPALGWARGIGNLSMAAGVSIADPTSDLMTMIDRAQAALATQSPDLAATALPLSRWRQTANATFASMLRRSARLRAHRSVSNVGQLGDSLDRWGAATLHRVWFVGPLAHPPYNSFIATGHGPSTLVSVRTSPTWMTDDHARALEEAAQTLV
jgi:hypothetical protein